MLKIAISGQAKAGKNTVAQIITECLNLKKDECCVSAFADRLKYIIEQLFPGCDREALYGASELRQNIIVSELNKDIEIKVSYRDVALELGKLGRRFNPLFWVAHLAQTYRNIPLSSKGFIICDVRFIEEMNWARDNGFKLIRVKRDQEFKINDISETEQTKVNDKEFDYIIDNNASLSDLKLNIETMLKRLL